MAAFTLLFCTGHQTMTYCNALDHLTSRPIASFGFSSKDEAFMNQNLEYKSSPSLSFVPLPLSSHFIMRDLRTLMSMSNNPFHRPAYPYQAVEARNSNVSARILALTCLANPLYTTIYLQQRPRCDHACHPRVPSPLASYA